MGVRVRGAWRDFAFCVALLLTLFGPSAALAHATLLTADPADGAVVKTPPSMLVLSYNEPVVVLAAVVRLPDGETVALDFPATADKVRRVPLPERDLPGTRAVTVRVASGDGHPVETVILYSVGAPTPGVVPPDTTDPAVRIGLWATLTLALGAMFLAAGGFAHRTFLAGEGRTGAALPVLGLVAVGFAGALHQLDAVGGRFALLATPLPWTRPDPTSFKSLTSAVAASFAFVAIGWILDTRPLERLPTRIASVLRAIAALLAVAASGLALAASGHAATAEPRLVTEPALVLHGIALSLWLGALPPLFTAARHGGPGFRRALRRFSSLAPFAVAALALGGAALAGVQLTVPADLWTTAYGRVLALKLGLVGLLLGLAGWNRWRLTRPALDGDGPATTSLRRTIGAELCLAGAILAVVGLFQFTPPPRALAQAAAEPAYAHVHTATAMADVTVTPGRAGPVRVTAMLLDGDFGPLPARDVRFRVQPVGDGGAGIEAPAVLGPEGYAADGLTLSAPGRWSITVTGAVEGKPLRLVTTVDIRP